jgi:hypothetical protein
MTGRWRWALVLGWPFACLNPMPDDFPNHHEEDREERPTSPPTDGNTPGLEESPATAAPDAEGSANGGYESDEASAPDAGAPPADAGAKEDGVSP